jgi:hypothetical protein
MQCLVDGCEVPASALARQVLNFGQPWPEPAVPLPYRLTLEGRDFGERFRDVYQRSANEEAADIPNHKPGEIPVLDRWQELGYPPLEELFRREPALLARLIEWFDGEALDQVVPAPEGQVPQFVINSLQRATVAEGRVCLEGRAYRQPPHALDAKTDKQELVFGVPRS